MPIAPSSPPFCPLLLQARAAIPLVRARADVEQSINEICDATPTTDGPLYPDPTQAPGTRCLGSACAWWEAQPEVAPDAEGSLREIPSTHGRCSQAPAADWRRDPTIGGAP